jgi:hypothetical protein
MGRQKKGEKMAGEAKGRILPLTPEILSKCGKLVSAPTRETIGKYADTALVVGSAIIGAATLINAIVSNSHKKRPSRAKPKAVAA